VKRELPPQAGRPQQWGAAASAGARSPSAVGTAATRQLLDRQRSQGDVALPGETQLWLVRGRSLALPANRPAPGAGALGQPRGMAEVLGAGPQRSAQPASDGSDQAVPPAAPHASAFREDLRRPETAPQARPPASACSSRPRLPGQWCHPRRTLHGGNGRLIQQRGIQPAGRSLRAAITPAIPLQRHRPPLPTVAAAGRRRHRRRGRGWRAR